MRSQLSFLSMGASTSPITSQPFLITPLNRFRFTVLFVLATGLGWVLEAGILRTLDTPMLPQLWQTGGLLGAFVTGLVAGAIVSALQWLVLRRYLSDWLWILASSVGYVLLMTTQEAWWSLLDQLLKNTEWFANISTMHPRATLLASGAISTLLSALCAVWLGIAQWLFLRQYTQSSRWWVMIPSIAVLLSSGLFTLGSLVPPLININLALEPTALGSGILGTIQAIALCALRQRVSHRAMSSSSLLATAPEISSRSQVRYLSQKVYTLLDTNWESEVVCDRPVSYWVGVDDVGGIAAYEPIGQTAIDYLPQTPFPLLIKPRYSGKALPALARFRITFQPSGTIRVQPEQGIPLVWIAVLMLLVVVGASVIVAHSGITQLLHQWMQSPVTPN